MAAWGIGAYVQTRRDYRRELQRRTALLEREGSSWLGSPSTKAGIDRRELHDIVAHSVTVMLVSVRGATAAQ